MGLFKKKPKVSQDELDYVSSLSSAVLQKSASFPKIVLILILITFGWFILWASFAEIDERVQGEGKVIPSSKIKKIQNLEGGIVKNILIKEGDKVNAGQIIMKIDNSKSIGYLGEKEAKYDAMRAKMVRLKAEANSAEFNPGKLKDEIPTLIESEYYLYKSDKSRLEDKIRVLRDQISQKNNEHREMKAKMSFAEDGARLIQEEVDMKRPLVEQGIESRPDFLKLVRELNEKKNEYESARLSLPRINSEIREIRSKITEARSEFKNKAREELNEIMSEVAQVEQLKGSLEDQVKRTDIVSPVDGIVKSVLVTTIGEVVKPGGDMVEIVPIDDTLLIEVKVMPRDIAFLFPGQKAMVKFTAYDFAIYGGLDGKVLGISADSIVEKTAKGEQSYFLVKVKTDKNYLEKGGRRGEIIPGMTTSVDILTGKKTIMDYLLKPILKAKSNALKER
jgi:adhesin transport system membrane fusion protein